MDPYKITVQNHRTKSDGVERHPAGLCGGVDGTPGFGQDCRIGEASIIFIGGPRRQNTTDPYRIRIFDCELQQKAWDEWELYSVVLSQVSPILLTRKGSILVDAAK